jgi:hypothetical protein
MTYFTGIDHPDREPGRNRYTEAKRQSTFTEKVAATVKDGDLYFSKRSPAHQRFYVEVDAKDSGLDETGLLCVTHVFKKPWPDMDGRWEDYDGGGNLVIRIRRTDDQSLAYGAMECIEQALYRTPLGRAVGREGIRKQAESLCKAFGIELHNEDERIPSTFITNVESEALAKQALLDLLTFAPENGYDDRLGPIFAEADGVGFAQDAEQYVKLINGESDGFGTEREHGRGSECLPLMSQPVFYGVLGYKGNGRSFQGRITRLMEAIGLTEDDLR